MRIRSMCLNGLVVLLIALVGLRTFTTPANGADDVGKNVDPKYDGKTIEEWIRVWHVGNFQESQQALTTLAKVGEAAVPPLSRLIRENHWHAGYAMNTLAEMGPAARPALPELLKLARNKSAEDPVGWTWNLPIRAVLFISLAKMSWASDELVPLLENVGKDEQETDQIRGIAVNSLRGMGPAALPALRGFTISDSPQVRRNAVAAIVEIEQQAGKDRNTTRQEFIDQNPFDSNVPRYLADMKNIYNLGRIHPPTQRIKQIYRRALQEKPKAKVAWQLATIIRNGLANTDLMWAAPSDGVRSRSRREDPDENYETLASALKIAFAHSEPNSELWKKAGLSLAKLRLLQGDWDGMNESLTALGQQPIPAELRPILPPPPVDWENLKQDWQPADKKLRSGTCGIEFRFLRRGGRLQGVRGVHVLVKERPKPNPERVFRSGIRVDTLLYATQPLLEEPYQSFGYLAQDRSHCRYGVSNEHGFVLIEGLPTMPVIVEILMPTANFEDRGHEWDLLMDTVDGLQIADRLDPRSVAADKPPALIELQEGEVVRYPIMFVRSQLSANVQDWDSVDKDQFVLKWDGPTPDDIHHYNVELTLSAPAQHPDMSTSSPVLVTETEEVTESSWPVGERGVGKLRLVPGNFYLIEIDAVRDGDVVASLPRHRVWVPWEHRESDPPLTGMSSQSPPFYHDIWFRTNVNGKSLEERLPALIRDSAKMFETEYNRLGMAWLDLHKNKAGAAEDLQRLVEQLPPGNVVRATAQSLLDAAASEQPIPRRLKFVAPKTVSDATD